MTPRSSPAVSREHYLPEAYREGWLLFESAIEKRRLAPVPRDWESLSDQALQALCAGASPQSSRRREEVGAAKASAPREEPLRPKLVDIERQLDQTLDEVCEAAEASKLDTGELIRVEETLALAAEAAKEAVSLRRRMHVDRERDSERTRGGESPIKNPGSGSDPASRPPEH